MINYRVFCTDLFCTDYSAQIILDLFHASYPSNFVSDLTIFVNMDKFVKLAFVAGTGALAGGALGAFAVERDLLKARRENNKLKRDFEAAEDRTKRLVDEEQWQKQHLATTFAAPLAQQWMQMQGMSHYEADWKKAAIGPLVEKAMHNQLLRAPSDYGTNCHECVYVSLF